MSAAYHVIAAVTVRRPSCWHSRLSIIDLGVRANQPLRRRTSCWSSNGELYNYLELRRHTCERRGVAPFLNDQRYEVLLRLPRGIRLAGTAEGKACELGCSMSAMAAHAWRDLFAKAALRFFREVNGVYCRLDIKFHRGASSPSLAIRFQSPQPVTLSNRLQGAVQA